MIGPSDNCPTHLIPDAPADEDAFGPHSRVANAIADLVRSERGGKTIGLEGGWGSGKSTVVNLLRSELESEPNIAVAVFDAWAHQGDPLRRTFLERLIAVVLERKWADRRRWTKRAEELARRRRITETRDVARLTLFAKCLSVAMFLVPLGMSLLAVGLSEGLGAAVVAGAALSATPLLVIGTCVARSIVPTQFGAKKENEEGDGCWAIFVGRQVKEQRTETFETPDPTSVEFRQTFLELMNSALSNEDRKLMLVLDNLDRVNPGDALTIWSTLQTFVQHSEDFDPKWFDRLWVLIPYDRDGIRRLWEKQRQVDAESQAQEEGAQAGTASTFLDKSLQIRFEVPPPALSDWQGYLLRLLVQALPNHEPDEFHAVYVVYALYPAHRGSRPTPRDLKLYVNRIGALHRQWQDRFPLQHLAYYSLVWRDGRNVEEGLQRGTMPERELKSVLGEGIQDNLAALRFNVEEIERARQLLLVGPIREAILSGDGDSLREAAEANAIGFWPVLEWMLGAGEVQFESPAVLAKAGVCFLKSGLFGGDLTTGMRNILAHLRNQAKETEEWAPFDADMAEGIASMLELLRVDAQSARIFLDPITKAGIGEGDGKVSPSAWVDGVLLILRKLESLGLNLPDVVEKGLTVPADSVNWVQVCDRLVQEDGAGHFWPLLRPKASVKSISEAVSEAVGGGTASEQHVNTIRVTNVTVENASWGTSVDSIKDRLQGGSSLASGELRVLLEAVWTIRKEYGPTEDVIRELATKGHILHHLNQAASESDANPTAWCIFTILDGDPTGAEQPAVGNSAAGHEQLTNILTSPQSHTAVIVLLAFIVAESSKSELLFRILESRPNAKEFVVLTLQVIFDGPASNRIFTSELMLEQWSLLKEELDDEQERFRPLVQRLVAEGDLVRRVCEDEFDPGNAGLYAELVAAGACKDADFRQWCTEALGRIERERWAEHLANGDEVLRFITELANEKVDLNLGVHYLDALGDFADVVARGQAPGWSFEPSWAKIIGQLSGERRELLGRRALQAAINAGGNPAEPFFSLFGSEISVADVNGNNDSVDRFLSVLLDKQSPPGLCWMAGLLEGQPRLLEKHPDKAGVAAFMERVEHAVSQPPEGEAGDCLRRIADALHIETPPPGEGEKKGGE